MIHQHPFNPKTESKTLMSKPKKLSRFARFESLMVARESKYPSESFHDRFAHCMACPDGAVIVAEAKAEANRKAAK